MSTAVSLGLAPIGGGTLNTTLTESLWLGGKRFFVVYSQGAPNYLIASIIDLSLDPYAGGTPTQTITTNQVIGSVLPQDRPMLIRLDYNRVLMFFSGTNKTDSYTGSNIATKAFDAWVLEIDTNNNINVVSQTANAVPAAFMNYTQANFQPTATKAVQGTQGYNGRDGFCTQPGWSSYLPISADGAAVSRVLVATRQMPQQNNFMENSTATLWDVQYTVASATLTITSRFTTPATVYGYSNISVSFVGPNDFPFVSLVPGTTQVLFGYVNYDPTNGVGGGGFDAYRGLANQTGFYSGNPFYLIDYTQAPATWTAATSVTTARRGSVVAPLDSNRMLEITAQVCATGTVNYCRVYTISSGTWSNDIVTDASTATVNKNGSVAFGLPGQVTPLGNDHLLVTFTTRPATGNGLAGTAYWGIYRLLGTSVLQAVPSLGVPALAPLTFQRGADAFIQRTAGQDPQATSPNLAYDYYGRTGQVSYQFMRFANPPF